MVHGDGGEVVDLASDFRKGALEFLHRFTVYVYNSEQAVVVEITNASSIAFTFNNNSQSRASLFTIMTKL